MPPPRFVDATNRAKWLEFYERYVRPRFTTRYPQTDTELKTVIEKHWHQTHTVRKREKAERCQYIGREITSCKYRQSQIRRRMAVNLQRRPSIPVKGTRTLKRVGLTTGYAQTAAGGHQAIATTNAARAARVAKANALSQAAKQDWQRRQEYAQLQEQLRQELRLCDRLYAEQRLLCLYSAPPRFAPEGTNEYHLNEARKTVRRWYNRYRPGDTIDSDEVSRD